MAFNAFSRWMTRCMSAAGNTDLTPLEILVLHNTNHRGRDKRLTDISFLLNIEDTHTVNYALRKLLKMQLLTSEKRGKEVFYNTGCTSCHTPSFVTHRLEDKPEQSFQLIWPYTDMLLHDMGEDLADNRPEAQATGQEWRTPPLWGIGLTEQVSGHTYFLHDGRARSLLEAVLWHGGEAQTQRDAVTEMTTTDRDALIRFLESL